MNAPQYITREERRIDFTPQASTAPPQEDYSCLLIPMDIVGYTVGAAFVIILVALLAHFLNWWAVISLIAAGMIGFGLGVWENGRWFAPHAHTGISISLAGAPSGRSKPRGITPAGDGFQQRQSR